MPTPLQTLNRKAEKLNGWVFVRELADEKFEVITNGESVCIGFYHDVRRHLMMQKPLEFWDLQAA